MSNEHQACGDQRSVRCVPRELLDDLRSKVIQYVSEAKNFSAEIHQIAGKPPQLVLSLDGNTAGVDYNTNSQVVDNYEKTNIILVQNIPPSLDEEVLELFFESKKKKGGGPVKHVKLDREKNWAIIEFYEPEGFVCFVLYLDKISGERLQDHWSSGSETIAACDLKGGRCRQLIQIMKVSVDIVLSKRPVTLLDTPVDIQPYLPLLSRDDHLTSLDIQGLPSKLTEDLLAFQLSSILNPATMLEENHQADEISSAPDERITETITNIRELHLRYLQVSDFKKRITDKFPDLSIQLLPKTILFDGHASEIEAAKSDLNAFIDSLSIHTIDSIDRLQLEIIQSKQAIEYINSLLKSLNLLVTWEVDKGMLIFCCSQDSVVFCHRILVELIKKKIVTTPSDSSVLYTSVLWRECVTNIDKKYKGLCNLYLKNDESGVTIVATDNAVDEVAHEVQMFLTDHAMVQQTMTTDFVMPSTNLQSLLEQAILELPNHLLHVVASLIPVCSTAFSNSHKFIFTLRGTAKGIRLLKMSLNNKYKVKIY